MQAIPLRLSQALRTAFQTAKPIHRETPLQFRKLVPSAALSTSWPKEAARPAHKICVRYYSDEKKDSKVARKIEDAEHKIQQIIDSRADFARDAESTSKPLTEETIIHTIPEASSIGYTSQKEQERLQDAERLPSNESETSPRQPAIGSATKYAEWAASRWQNSPLPSQIASLRSRASKRFSYFMDNLQSNIVIAAHHLNDLTGYTGIERLKREIDEQEKAVQNARIHVKESRDKYTEAVAMRSTTQREVNDLLHRKHAWSPTDLERFTHLYRSDHANEQAEQRTHQQVTEAEAQYEEASTRLGKSILARYHEEQIWSDKIRQMSTWGTWGLMGLNVLLFIVFQILVEPWRRRRLVRGFEEKVQAALAEKEKSTDEKLAVIRAERTGDQVVAEAVDKQSMGTVTAATEEVAAAIADAVTGSSDSNDSDKQAESTPASEEIEMAAEQVTNAELGLDTQDQSLLTASATTDGDTPSISEDSTDQPFTNPPPSLLEADTTTLTDQTPQPQTWQSQLSQTYNHALNTSSQTLRHYNDALHQQFNDKEHVVLSRREMTTKILEGVGMGIAFTCGVAFVLARTR